MYCVIFQAKWHEMSSENSLILGKMGCLKNDAICNLRIGSHRKMGPPSFNSGPLDLSEGHKVKGHRTYKGRLKSSKGCFFHLWTAVSLIRMTLDY